MKICIAGKNNIAVEIINYLLEEMKIVKENLYIMTNETDDGTDGWQQSLLKYTKKNNLNRVVLSDISHERDMVFLSLEFDKIIRLEKFKTDRLYNLHFSLLPKYKGMYTSVFPILNNEPYTGVTLHCIDQGIDTGAIIDQMKFKIDHYDTARDVYFNYIKYGIALVKKNMMALINGDFTAKEQNYLKSTYNSKSSINFDKIKIDLLQTAICIHNQIRAYNFKEYQQARVFENKITGSKILKKRSEKKAGTLLFEDSNSYIISSIDYDIVLFKANENEKHIS